MHVSQKGGNAGPSVSDSVNQRFNGCSSPDQATDPVKTMLPWVQVSAMWWVLIGTAKAVSTSATMLEMIGAALPSHSTLPMTTFLRCHSLVQIVGFHTAAGETCLLHLLLPSAQYHAMILLWTACSYV